MRKLAINVKTRTSSRFSAASSMDAMSWESWLFAARIAAYSARLVGKYLKSSASLIPAVLAISRVVVPLKPFWANKEAAAAMMLACRSRLDDRWFLGAWLDLTTVFAMLVSAHSHHTKGC